MSVEVTQAIAKVLAASSAGERMVAFAEILPTDVGRSLEFYRSLTRMLPCTYSSLGASEQERDLVRLIYAQWAEIGAQIDPDCTFQDLLPVSDYFVLQDVVGPFLKDQLRSAEAAEHLETIFGDEDRLPESSRRKLYRLLLEEGLLRETKARRSLLKQLQRFPQETLGRLGYKTDKIDEFAAGLIKHGVIQTNEDARQLIPLLLNTDEYLTFDCIATSEWRQYVQLLDSPDMVGSLAEGACVHLCRVSAIDRLMQGAPTGVVGRAVSWCLRDTWTRTSNVNYVADLFQFLDKLPDDEAISLAGTPGEGSTDLVPVAIAVSRALSQDRNHRAEMLVSQLTVSQRDALRVAFHGYVSESAWRLSGAGPTAVYPDDPAREARERAKQEKTKAAYVKRQAQLLDEILSKAVEVRTPDGEPDGGTLQAQLHQNLSRYMNKNPRPFQGSEPFAFACYSHQDRKVVDGFIALLSELGLRIWFDAGIVPGREWSSSIADHLQKAQLVVLFVSQESLGSRYVLDELHFAYSEGKPILVILLEDVKLPADVKLRVGRFQYVSGWDCQLVLRLGETVQAFSKQ